VATVANVRVAFLGLASAAVLAFAPSEERLELLQETHEVTIREGTNMAAVLSPDGSTLALDALGRIWVLPAEGGSARPLTDPLGDARQPTWSPDGVRIAFQAYWDGNYHIWAVNRDGTGLEQLTNGPYDHREPHWSPDGSKIALSSDRDGTYGIYELSLASGDVSRLTDGEGNEYGPAYGPDGRTVAYMTDGEGAGAGLWVTRAPGDGERIVDLGEAQGFGASWSPDGGEIAYNELTRGTSTLRVVGTSSGALSRTVSDPAEDVFPFRASWTGSGRLIYTSDGRIRTRSTSGGSARDVPFEATVTLDRHNYRKSTQDLSASGRFPVRGIVSPSVSPDGGSVAFSALGDLWIMSLGESPERITDDPWVEVDPAWSPDGHSLVFASDREGEVDLWLRDVDTGEERRITEGGGRAAAWSPGGRQIAFIGGSEGGLRVLNMSTGEARTIRSGLNNPGRPTWSPDGSHIGVSAHWRYSTRFREGVNRVLLMPVLRPAAEDQDLAMVDGTPEQVPNGSYSDLAAWGLAQAGDVDLPPEPVLQGGERMLDFGPHSSVGTRSTSGPIWSPDGQWMAYVSTGVLWVIPVTAGGDASGPPRRLTNEVSDDPSWVGDSESLVYLTTDRLRRVWLRDGRIEDIPMDLTWERKVTEGRMVIHAGGLFDGTSDRIRRNVDIVVEGNRIVVLESHNESRHRGRVVDASDGVVSPGLIEMHTHGGLSSGEQMGRLWLSFGVTTIRTPSSDPYEMVEGRESTISGRRIGPRIFGTGGSVDGSRIYYAGSSSLGAAAQVELELERAEALKYDVIKTYVRLSDPTQKRIIEDAHAMGIPVTSHELYPGVAYGADGVEHVRGTSRRGYSTKVTELYRSYDDVIALLAASGMTITPTVGIYGGFALVAQDDPSLFDDARVRTFFPEASRSVRSRGDAATTRRLVSDMAGTARRVHEAGGTVIMGTDSPIIPQGLSLLAEMEALVRYGGMTPVDVMRATTSVPARVMGYEEEFGTVAAGRLADLVVFGANPLEDIRATRDVRMVVKDGVVYEAEELLRRP
jgi:Tol biopolymer transport system component/imidazolonepropionase-like amidohydrolase